MKQPTITVIGAGFVGLSTAALLSNTGYKVYLLELNEHRLKTIQGGKSFFYEDGIDNLIKSGLESNLLVPTNNYETAIPHSDIIFSCVGTPDNPDGSSNMSYINSSAEETAKYIKDGSIYVQKSTVPVETGEGLSKMFKEKGKEIDYVSNPEFLREGTAIIDTLWFDRIVCGAENNEAIEKVFELYRSVEKNRKKLASIAGLQTPDNESVGKYIETNLVSAELIKITANAFLAMKISFANSIAKLADTVGADVVEVMNAVGEDKRIGRAFLNAGRGYGGGCFPKDMSSLIDVMNKHGADASMLTSAQDVNASMPGYVVNRLQNAVKDLKGLEVAVLGLAFKAGTSDTRRSPGIFIANDLVERGAKVRAYDPQAGIEELVGLNDQVNVVDSAEAAIGSSSAVIIATEWPQFKKIDFSGTGVKHIVDGMNMLDNVPEQIQCLGIGRS